MTIFFGEKQKSSENMHCQHIDLNIQNCAICLSTCHDIAPVLDPIEQQTFGISSHDMIRN